MNLWFWCHSLALCVHAIHPNRLPASPVQDLNVVFHSPPKKMLSLNIIQAVINSLCNINMNVVYQWNYKEKGLHMHVRLLSFGK